MLRNNLKSWIDGEALMEILDSIDVRPDARAENLSISDWIHLSDKLGDTSGDKLGDKLGGKLGDRPANSQTVPESF